MSSRAASPESCPGCCVLRRSKEYRGCLRAERPRCGRQSTQQELCDPGSTQISDSARSSSRSCIQDPASAPGHAREGPAPIASLSARAGPYKSAAEWASPENQSKSGKLENKAEPNGCRPDASQSLVDLGHMMQIGELKRCSDLDGQASQLGLGPAAKEKFHRSISNAFQNSQNVLLKMHCKFAHWDFPDLLSTHYVFVIQVSTRSHSYRGFVNQ